MGQELEISSEQNKVPALVGKPGVQSQVCCLGCVTPGKLLNLFVPPFPRLYNEANRCSLPLRTVMKINWVDSCRVLAHDGKPSINVGYRYQTVSD